MIEQFGIVSICAYEEKYELKTKNTTLLTAGRTFYCLVMPNGDPRGGFFLTLPHMIDGFFSCSPSNTPFDMEFFQLRTILKARSEFTRSIMVT